MATTNAAHENARAKGFHKHGDEVRKRLANATRRHDDYVAGAEYDNNTINEVTVASLLAEVEFYKMVLAEHYGNRLMLIVGEVVEAHEEIRAGHDVTEVYYGPDGKPEGVQIELADVGIRLDDTFGEMGIDRELAEAEKAEFNARRAAMHGGKKF